MKKYILNNGDTSPAEEPYKCTAVNENVAYGKTIVTQIVQAIGEEDASNIFNEFLCSYFDDTAFKSWQITIEEI